MSDAPASGGSNVIGGKEVAETRVVPGGTASAARCVPLLLAVALIAGCTTGRTPRSPEVRLPQAFDAASVAGATIPLDRWWTAYDDPQLAGLVEQALANGFDTRTALSRLEEARGLRSASLAQLGPQGNIEGSGEVRQTEDLGGQQGIDIPGIPSGFSLTPSGLSGTANLDFNVSYELDFLGRRGAARRTAEGDFAAARFNAEASRVAVTAEIADTLFQARALAVQLEDARATLRIQEDLLRAARIRGERGLAPTADAARVEADVAQASAQLRDLDAQLRTLRRSILLLTAMPVPISTRCLSRRRSARSRRPLP